MQSYKFRLTRANNVKEEVFASGNDMNDALVMLVSRLGQTGSEEDAIINFQFLPSDLTNEVDLYDKQVNDEIPQSTVKNLRSRASRRDRFDHAMGNVSEARAIVEELRDELQSWLDNIPENLQNGSKADELNEAISTLEDTVASLEEAEGQDVTFPSMR